MNQGPNSNQKSQPLGAHVDLGAFKLSRVPETGLEPAEAVRRVMDGQKVGPLYAKHFAAISH